jgi:hypothetical protein
MKVKCEKCGAEFNNKMFVFSEYCTLVVYTCQSSSNCYSCSLTKLSGRYIYPNSPSSIIYEAITKDVSLSSWYFLFDIPDPYYP